MNPPDPARTTTPSTTPTTGARGSTEGARNPWAALISLCIGFFMLLLDTTIVNIAIPDMLTDFRSGIDDIIWVNSIYLLTYAVPLLLTGRLGDRFGPKRLFLSGLFLFTFSSLACGLSGSVSTLILARAVQGLGAAAMMPQTMAFVYYLFPAGKRGAAMGMWGATAGLATISGPLLGGLLVGGVGWRWIFFVNVPIGIVGLVMVARLVPNWQPKHSHRFDPIGIALFSVGLAAIVFGLQEGQRYAWGAVLGPITITELIVGGVVLLALFTVWQRRNPVEPLLPLGIFRYRNFSFSSLANMALGFALIGTVLPLMLYLQSVRGYSAIQAGLLAAPMALGSGVTSAIVGRIAERVDGRILAGAGFLCYAGGLGLVAWIMQADTPPLHFVPALLVAGIGMGATFAPLATLGTLGLPPRLVGAGSGLFNTFRMVGSVVGSAAVGVLLQARLSTELVASARSVARGLPEAYRERFVDGFAQAGGSLGAAGGAGSGPGGLRLPPGVPADVARHVHDLAQYAFVHGFTAAVKTSTLLPAAVLLLGVVACLAMQRKSREPR